MPASATPPAGSARDRFEWLHAVLRERICALDYAPGSQLSEGALAEEFGISRTPLRRVLARLEDEGLVESRHGVGTIVTDVDTAELEQVYHLRMELAGLVVVLDPVQPDAALMEEFRALQKAADTLRAAPSARAFTQINSAFFAAMMQLTDNAPLREISERLYYRTARIWLKSVSASQLDLVQEIDIFAREVEEIVSALELGDLVAAGHLRRAHISMSFARLRQQPGETSVM